MAARVNATKAPRTAAPAVDTTQDVPEFTAPVVGRFAGPVLFRIAGVDYPMRADRTFGASLKYLRTLTSGGPRVAEMALLDHVVGPAAVDALIATEPTREHWIGVVQRASEHVLGTPEAEPETEGN